MFLLTIAIPLLLISFYLLYFSIFISIEIPLVSLFSVNIPISFLLDWMSLMFLFTVTFISSMILLFSTEYIPPSEHKQFSYLLLSFVLSMFLLIISDNIIFILLGWDGLGITSFILVIYYQNFSSAASGSITIFSNRLGDIFILLSIAFLTIICDWNFCMNKDFPFVILLFLIFAACSKSAQFPFSAWLPAAMAAPTPISALVHSSTLVTAGIYLLIRIMNFNHPLSLLVILIISSLTAIFASLSANWEMDMKKIVALSTLSQIAMMLFAISLGSISLAFFHLIIHALFKSMMFLCVGSIIHSSHYQDMRFMGSSMNSSPLIHSILGIATMSLMGVPFMSGFFSKDPVVETVIYSKIFSFLSFLMILSIGMTSLYSLRLVFFSLKFFIKSKPDNFSHNINFMDFSIIFMAPISIFAGAALMWVISPEQLIILPNNFKFSILLFLFLGMLFGTLLSWSKNSFKKLGQSAISLWFVHFLTSSLAPLLYPLMSCHFKNDKNWQEEYGPHMCFNFSSFSSPNPDLMSSQLLFILLMMTFYPILIFCL